MLFIIFACVRSPAGSQSSHPKAGGSGSGQGQQQQAPAGGQHDASAAQQNPEALSDAVANLLRGDPSLAQHLLRALPEDARETLRQQGIPLPEPMDDTEEQVTYSSLDG
jgi:hypothetical protein